MIDRYTVRHIPGFLADLQPVTFRSKIGQGSFSSYSLMRARPDNLTRELATGDGITVIQVRSWEIWQQDLDNATPIGSATLPAPLPKINDVITDQDGVNWVVHRVGQDLFGNVHNCECEKAVP